LSVRTSPETVAALTELATLEGRSRADEVRLVLETGLRSRRMRAALARYRDGEATLSRTAEIAGVTVYEVLDAMEAMDVSMNLDIDTVIRAAEAVN